MEIEEGRIYNLKYPLYVDKGAEAFGILIQAGVSVKVISMVNDVILIVECMEQDKGARVVRHDPLINALGWQLSHDR